MTSHLSRIRFSRYREKKPEN